MRPVAFTSSLALLALLGLAGATRAQVLDPIQYDLYPGSRFEFGCSGPCACPIFFSGPLDLDASRRDALGVKSRCCRWDEILISLAWPWLLRTNWLALEHPPLTR